MCKKKDRREVCPPSRLVFRKCIASNWKLCTQPMQNQCIRCRQTWAVGTPAPDCLLQLKNGEKEEEVEEGGLDKLIGRFEEHGDGSYSYI